MKNRLTIIFVSILGACTSTQPITSGSAAKADPPGTVSLITDPGFTQGIVLRGANSAAPGDKDTLFPFKRKNGQSVWKLAEWGSRYSLDARQPQQLDSGIAYGDTGKKITFQQEGNTAKISFEVLASREFKAPRKANEDWPHLLLEQEFNQVISVNKMNALLLKMGARLMYCDNKTEAGKYDEGLHTAQFSLYLVVNNLNKNSAGYKDFIWFGVPLYDYRYKDIPAYQEKDQGKEDATGKFIYSLSGKEVFDGSLHDRQWTPISIDLHPAIKKAFETAQQNGFLKSSTLEDMYVSGMNIGWEVPGTFDAGIQLEGISLKAVTKSK
ncbi:hypothetical protein [Chitinophaga defluvii]|uniref:Lipoprotein n=1 Tax=Chitinophaga defluvii TaxID=3163343 RepID=A0ABV2T332_9BACT